MNFQFPISNFQNQKKGQAALIAVILMLVLMLSAIFAASAIALKEAKVAEESKKSRFTFFAAEAGIDDAIYRLFRNKLLSSNFSVSLNGATAGIAVTDVSASQKEIKAFGDFSGRERALRSNVETGITNVSFFYGVQVGDGGLSMGNSSRVSGNVFSNGNITGNNSAKITGDATVAGGIFDTASAEWTTHDSDHFFATVSTNRDIAQSFVANATDNLNKVSVYLGKVGSPSGNITLKIANDNSGKPATSNIANATITNSSVGTTASWVDVSFSSPPGLTNGNKYWIVLDFGSNSATNYWNWRKDASDGYANNTGKYTSNCCSGNPTWTDTGGDLAFRAWIGGVNTKIEGITIGDASSGSGHANLFVDTTIHGTACPNSYCFVENPARQELPISDGVIQDWKDEALAGGTCAPPTCTSAGALSLSNESLSLGPIYIPGDLSLNNDAVLTMTGTIWVGGDVSFNNDSTLQLSSTYGENSGVMVADGSVSVNNDVLFLGSGDPDSYLMMVSG